MLLTFAIIDDLSRNFPIASIGTSWQLFTDRVMGGASNGTLVRDTVAGRAAIRIRGNVSLENNGGFVQMCQSASNFGPRSASNFDPLWRRVEPINRSAKPFCQGEAGAIPSCSPKTA